ncbi:uncharacterized protein ISCGN_019666 [Ixodes scapularis]
MDMRTMKICSVGRWSSGDDLISDDSWQTNKQVSSQRMAIEIAQRERRQLYLCFLNISRAYDSVNHEKLWRQLAKRELGEEWITLLKEIYKETTLVAQWQEEMTHPVAITKGLRQGCPLSPLLFMLYIAGFGNRLQDCAEGFTLEYTEGKPSALSRRPVA